MPVYKKRSHPENMKRHAELRQLQRMWVPRVYRTRQWFLCKEFTRTHGLHKLSVFNMRIGKGYCYSAIADARISR